MSQTIFLTPHLPGHIDCDGFDRFPEIQVRPVKRGSAVLLMCCCAESFFMTKPTMIGSHFVISRVARMGSFYHHDCLIAKFNST